MEKSVKPEMTVKPHKATSPSPQKLTVCFTTAELGISLDNHVSSLD